MNPDIEPNPHYEVWQYDVETEYTSDNDLSDLQETLNQNCIAGTGHATVENDMLKLTHCWTKCECWKAYDIAVKSDRLTIQNFTVNKIHNSSPATPTIQSTITENNTEKKVEKPTLNEVIDIAHKYHPMDTQTFTGTDVLYKCGDISAVLKLGLYFEFGINIPIIGGAIINPDTFEGWAHGFLKITPDQVTDITTPVYLDGTAKQFADEYDDFPQTLGPENDINHIHIISPSHKHFQNYVENREVIEIKS